MMGMSAVAMLLAASAEGLSNGLALTPPMGWSSWNSFHRNIDSSLFLESAQAIQANGMQAAGYEYINIDGGWWEGSDTGTIARNATGFVMVNSAKFPKESVTYTMHRYGHYTDAGKAACNGDRPMSEGYEVQDGATLAALLMALFASWEIDMIKVDACYTNESSQTLITRWSNLLNSTGRPILLSNCRNGCLSDSEATSEQWQSWCTGAVNMWRTSGDVSGGWSSFLSNLDTLKHRGVYGKPGSWNDPDILEVGVGEFAFEGNLEEKEMLAAWSLAKRGSKHRVCRAHFSMWSITSSPLLAGNDVRHAPEEITEILTNRQAIRVNQAYAGNAGDLVVAFNTSAQSTMSDAIETWVKPLKKGEVAVAVLNRNTAGHHSAEFVLADVRALLGFATVDTPPVSCVVQDIWANTTAVVSRTLELNLPPKAVAFLRVSGCALSSS